MSGTRWGAALIAAGAFVTSVSAMVHAQTGKVVVEPRYTSYRWNYYASPATAISARIHAEADLLRAYGEATLDLAHAREVRARAVRQEISNSVEYVRAYWERRSIYEAEKMKRYVAPLKRKEIQDSKTWARLKDHPELNGPSIIRGDAQNFLLARLAGSVLAYQFSVANPKLSPQILSQLDLAPETLHALQLRQDLPGAQKVLFRADEGVPLRVDWWPYLLRDDGFASERKAYEKARQRAVSEAKAGPVSNEAASEVLAAFDKLNTRFDSRYPRQTRVKTVDLFQHHLAAKRFLQSLGGEILRLQTAGTLASSEELRFTGNNLVALLTHMSRNGLVFAAAQPGDEAAYHNVFRMMRDLYITVADDDDSGTGR